MKPGSALSVSHMNTLSKTFDPRAIEDESTAVRSVVSIDG